MNESRNPWLRLVTFCVGLLVAGATAFADELPLTNCLEQLRPVDVSQLRAFAASIGPSSNTGNLTIIEFDGAYDRGLAEPRQLVAQRFYQDHPDDYDFLIVFTTFEFETAGAHAFYNGIQNDTSGIGLPLYDNSTGFGSDGRLQGYIDMAALSRNSFVPQNPSFQFTLQVIAHELMHRWGSQLGFRDANGNPSADLIGPDQVHWSYFLDTDASVMYGNDWNMRADGSFESVAIRQRFSPLDLYSAGLYAASEVPPFNLIRGGTGSATDPPRLGAVSGGHLESISIDQVIAESGPRSPMAAQAQKDFRAAFILLKRPGEQVSAATTLALEQLRTRAQQYFSQITRSRANLRIFTTPDQVTGPGLPQILIGSGATATPPGIAAAIAWLEARQLADGHWQDHPSTALRDTIAAVEALQELHPGFAGLPAARGWIAMQTPVNLDDTTRRWALDASIADDATIAQARTDSGWALIPDWHSSSYDTALIAETRASHGSASISLAPTLASLTAFQRTDGAFAHVASGRGRVTTTARAAAALAALPDPIFNSARGRAVGWLEQRLLDYDGTSNNGLLTLSDFVELYVRAGTVPLSGVGAETIRQRIRTTQQVAGDWSGSVYLTATAALARARDQRGNLAVVGSPTATPASPSDGQRVLLSATVINSGNVPVPASVLRWFNGDPDQGGTQIGTDLAVPSLSANARVTIPTDWSTTAQAGVRNLWLVLDATDLVEETSELDNRAELVVTVQPPSSQADLTLDESDAHFTPGSVTSLPSQVQLTASLRNIGLQAANSALVRLSVVRNGQRTTLAETRVDVPPQSQTPVAFEFAATTAETLHLVLEADPTQEIAEGSDDNNSIALALPYGPSLDLELTDADLGFDAGSSSMVGRDMRFAVHLHNRGTIDSPLAQIQAEIVQGGTHYPLVVSAAQVPAGQSIVRVLTWRPSIPGNAQLQVMIDPLNQLVETREDNNNAQFDFTVADATQADLTIVSSSVAFTPEIALQGQPLTATLNVRNLGQDLNQPFSVGLYASDPRLGAAPLVEVQVAAGLGAGAETPVMLHVDDWPLSGDTNLFLVVDAASLIAESDEDNNHVVKLLRSLALPDLAVSLAGITLTPALPVAGEAVQARVTVRNLGAQDAASFSVRLYEGDVASGTEVPSAQTIPALAAGASTELIWNWTLGLASNARQVTVSVDSEGAVREGSTDNNIAMLPFDVQNANFFASERYISPNGDGIKDATAVVIRLEQNEPSSMRVLNGAQYVVRDFGAVSIDSALRGQVVWDGRDDRGRIVADGDYRVTAFSASQQVLGSTVVTVDNNRSSVLEAIDTPHAVSGQMPGGADVKLFPQASPRFGQVWGRYWIDGTSDNGIYRADTLFRTREPIVSIPWLKVRRASLGLTESHIVSAELSPDGQTLAFVIWDKKDDWTQDSLWTIDVDQVDTPVRVPLPPSTVFWEDMLVFLDASHVLLRNAGSAGQLMVVDLHSGSIQPFRHTTTDYIRKIEVIPDGVLITDQPGNLTFYSFDSSRPGLLLDPASEDWDQETAFELSPNKRSMAIHVRSESREAIELVEFASGLRKVMIELEPTVFTDSRAPHSRIQPHLLEFGWLQSEGVLLVSDGRNRALKIFDASGLQISDRQFGNLGRTGNYANPPETVVVGSVPAPRGNGWNFPLDGYTTFDCPRYYADGGFGVERQAFDPTNGRLYLSLGEKAITLETGEAVYLNQRDGIVEEHSVQLFGNDSRIEFSGSSLELELESDNTRFPLVPNCPDDHSPAWPLMIFADGARIQQDGRIETLSGGVSSKPWPYAKLVQQVWPDDSRLLLSNNRVVTSLLNGSAVLKAQNVGRGIQLYGVAADRNFAYYELDWAPIDNPEQWNVLTTASSDEIFMEEFLTWVPPQPGTFKIRLRVVDRAGNSTFAATTASSFVVSPIDSFTVTPRFFSPNGDGVQDEAVVRYRVRQPATLDFRIEDANGQVIKSVDVTYGASDLGAHEFRWDGRDESGAVVPDGRYRLRVVGFAVWLVVDNTEPEIAGKLIQAYRQNCALVNSRNDCRVLIAPTVRYAVDESNLDILRVESALPGTNDWEDASGLLKKNQLDGRPVTDEGAWLDRVIQLQNFAGRRLRLLAIDRGGNRRTLPLGNAVEGLWLQAEDPLRSAVGQLVARFQYQPQPFEDVSAVAGLLPNTVFKEIKPHWLVAADGALGLVQVSVETSPEEDPESWTERGAYPIEYQTEWLGTISDAAGQRSINLPLITDLLEINKIYLVRLRGTRVDGSVVLSNIGKIALIPEPTNGDGSGGGDGGASSSGFISFFPVLRDQCNGAPSGEIGLSYSVGMADLRSVRISYVDGNTLLRVTALETGEPGGALHIPIDGWPEGRYEATLEADSGSGYVLLATEYFTVETAPPVIDLIQPAAGDRICALDTVVPVTQQSTQAIVASFDVVSAGMVGYQLEIGQGQTPLGWECLTSGGDYRYVPGPGWSDVPATHIECPDHLTEVTTFLGSSAYVNKAPIYQRPPRTDFAPYNGLASLRLKATNWSGGSVCAATTVLVDSVAELTEKIPPTRQLMVGEGSPVGIGSNDSNGFGTAIFHLHANEELDIRSEVHRAYFSPSGQLALEEPVLGVIADLTSINGDFDITWDGRVVGTLVGDGLYGVRVSASDGCAHAKNLDYAVHVDTTPPSIEITAPRQGESIALGTVEISATTDDPLLAGWTLDVASSAFAGSWRRLAQGSDSSSIPRVLAQWQRLDAVGPAHIRLRAFDLLGNTSETVIDIELLAPPQLIVSASTQPLLFSPNGDGVLDVSQVLVGLQQPVTLDVIAAGGTLFSGAAPAGAVSYDWDGRNAANTIVADGDYPVSIHATDPQGIASPETVLLTVSVDNTPPAVEFLQPSGAFANAEVGARVRISDAHLVEYSISLKRLSDGVIVASTQGTQSGEFPLLALVDQAEGDYQFSAEARDGAGNRSQRELTFTLDKTLPGVDLVTPADGAALAAAVATSVRGSVSDDHLASFTLALAPESIETWTDLASGSTGVSDAEILSWRPNLPDGHYRLRLRAVDQAGNAKQVIHAVTIDSTPPVALITSPVEGGFVRSALDVEGTATDANFAEYRLSVARVAEPEQWSLVHIGTSPVAAASLAQLTLALADGDYFLRLVVSDKAGLSATARVQVRMRTSPPPIPLALVGHVLNNRDAFLEWQAVDHPELGGYNLYRGGVRVNAEPISLTRFTETNVPEGQAQYWVRAVDLAGNESAPSNTVSLNFDRTPPLAQLFRPADGERVRGVVSIVGTAYSQNDFKEYRVSAEPINPPGSAAELRRSPLAVEAQSLADWSTLGMAEEARIRLHLEAGDQSGNIGSASVEVVIDNLPPAAPSGLTATLAGADGQLNWNPNSEADLLGYLLYRDGHLANFSGNPPLDLRSAALTDTAYLDLSVPNGQHVYVVHAIDRAGNVSPPSDPATLDPVTRPPHLSIISPSDGAVFETSIEFNATSADLDIAEARFSWRPAAGGVWTEFGAVLTEAPYRATWTPTALAYGEYDIRAIARDSLNQIDPAPPIVRVRYADLTAPPPLSSLAALADGDTVNLAWPASPAIDLAHYRIERNENGNWASVADVPAGEIRYADTNRPDGIQRYRILVVDTSDNASSAVVAEAHVFGILFEHPYTPTIQSAIDLAAASKRPGEVSLHVVNAQGSSDQQLGSTQADGAFVLNAMPLQLGHTKWTLTVTDASGNRSRAAIIDMDRGEKPAPPSGLTVSVDDRTVNLDWAANTEPDILGYRVFRNSLASPLDAALGLPITATSTAGYGVENTVDGDPATTWVVSYDEFDPADPQTDPALELTWTEPRIITKLDLSWSSATSASGNLDLYAWSGHAWIRIAQSRSAAATTQSLIPARIYRTDRVRLVVHRDETMAPNSDLQLADVVITEKNLLVATSLSDTLTDGRYHYRVVAYNGYAFASDPSDEAIADVGDAAGPDAVVLSGTVSGADATLDWTASASPDIDHYELIRDGSTIATIPAAMPRSHVDAALSNGEHHYVVVGYDGFNNAGAPSNEVVLSINQQGPGVPENLRVVVDALGGALDVSWQSGAGAPTVRYVVRRALAESGPYSIIAQPSATSLHDAPLSNGTTYFYTVAAIDSVGNSSAETAPVSGVPRDRSAPNGTRLTQPTIAEYPVFMRATETEVCGSAEPASTVLLENSAVTIATMQARAQVSVVERSLGNSFGEVEFAPNGRLALLLGLQNVQVVRLDNLASVTTLEASTRLEQWAAHGSTLFYATSNDEIVRQEIGQSPEVLPIAVTSLRFFAFSTDESLLILAGDYAANGNPPENGVWIIDRENSLAWRIAGLDPLEFETWAPRISVDARNALLFDGNGEIVLVDLLTHAVANRFAYSSYTLPSWSPDGRQFVYVADGATGGGELNVHAVTTQQTRLLATDANAFDAVAWSPFGEQIALLRNGTLDVLSAANGDSVLSAPIRSDERNRLQWTASGRLLSFGNRPPQLVELPGQFCFESVALLPGRNLFSASARDAAGNLGLASAAISVETPVDAVPDLSITESDILFVPASGQAGGSYSAIALVHNTGTAVARQPTLSARLIAPDGVGRSIAPTAAMPDIPAGGTASVTLPFGVLTQAGSYRLDLVLDPAAQIRELSETNNRAGRNLVLTSDALPLLTLSLGRNTYAPGEMVNAELRVSNPGNAFSGIVRASIIDAAGFSVAEFGDQPIQQLPFGGLWTYPVQFNSTAIQAGVYRINARLFDSSGTEIGNREAPFSISVERNIVLGLTTSTTQAAVGSVVSMEAAVDFVSGNASLSGARLRFSAAAPDGAEVWQIERPLGTLQAGYVLRMPQNWLTDSLPEGVYALHVELLSPDYQADAQSSITLFVDTPSAAITGSIELLPGATVIAGIPAQARYHVSNSGGLALTGVQVRLRAFDAPGNAALAQREDSLDLPPAAAFEESLALNAPPLALIPHLLLLEARLASDAPDEWRVLAQRSVSIIDALPPSIQLIEPDSGVLQPAVVPFLANIVDLHSGVMRAEVAVDAGSWQPLALSAEGAYIRALTGMSDGAHQLVVHAVDRWGNESTTPPIIFDVDATAPSIVIGGIVDGDLLNHAVSPTVSISDSHPGASETTLDGNTFVSATEVSMDGFHVLSAKATDAAGNTSARSVRFTIDTQAPTLGITEPVDGTITSLTSVDVVVQTEAGARVDLHTGSFNADRIADGSGVAMFPTVPLIPGDNPIDATATDAAGNVGGPVAINVRMQSASGLALIGTLQPASAEVAYGSALHVGLRLENPDSSALPVQNLRMRVLDPGSQVLASWSLQRAFAANEIYTDTLEFDTSAWSLATLSLQLDVERAGIWENLDTRSVNLVDRTAPIVSVVSPIDGAVLQGPLVASALVTDALSPIEAVEVQIDIEDWVPMIAVVGTNDKFESAPLNLVDGEHTLLVRARDSAANEGLSTSISFAIDTAAPLISIVGVAEGDVLAHVVAPVISISDPHLRNTTIRLDGQPYVSGTTIDTGGVHDIDVDSDDLAGNVSSMHVRFALDFDAPLVTFTSPAAGAVLLESTVEVTGITEPLAHVHLLNAGFVAEVFADENGLFAVPAVTLLVGDNAISAYAVDLAGNQGPSAQLNVRYEPAEFMLAGSFEDIPPAIVSGTDLAATYNLLNKGLADLIQLPVRVELRPAGSSSAVAQFDAMVDLPAYGTYQESIELPTSTLSVGDYRLFLRVYLANAQGQSGWVLLTSHSIAIRAGGCMGAVPPDRYFADGFDGDPDHIYCDGFEWFDTVAELGSSVAPLAMIIDLTLPRPVQSPAKSLMQTLEGKDVWHRIQASLSASVAREHLAAHANSPAVALPDIIPSDRRQSTTWALPMPTLTRRTAMEMR
ncbi:MAG: PD40 domain-containing protein [Xanthomonadales bacterium]|nr:PD40 domain-containing protein [Xanthomonadales bacterium]